MNRTEQTFANFLDYTEEEFGKQNNWICFLNKLPYIVIWTIHHLSSTQWYWQRSNMVEIELGSQQYAYLLAKISRDISTISLTSWYAPNSQMNENFKRMAANNNDINIMHLTFIHFNIVFISVPQNRIIYPHHEQKCCAKRDILPKLMLTQISRKLVSPSDPL